MRNVVFVFVVTLLSLQPCFASDNSYTVKATAFENLDRRPRVYLMLDRDDLFLYRCACSSGCCTHHIIKELQGWRENDPVILAAPKCNDCSQFLMVENLRQRARVMLAVDEESLYRLPKIEAISTGDLLKITLSNGTEWQVRRGHDNFYGSIWAVGDRVVISEDVSENPVLINMDQEASAFRQHPVAWAYGYNLRQLAVAYPE